jgi:hypothetical protein
MYGECLGSGTMASGAYFVFVGMGCDFFVYKRNIEVVMQC